MRGDKFLPREDRDAAQFLMHQLVQDGCQFAMNSSLKKLEKSGSEAHQMRLILEDSNDK